MTTTLLKNAAVLVTMDDARRELAGGSVLVKGNRVVSIHASHGRLPPAQEVIDCSGHVVMPGMINTHHHMYQSLTRTVPAALRHNI